MANTLGGADEITGSRTYSDSPRIFNTGTINTGAGSDAITAINMITA
ncbi:hypothetical protein [Chamaesiphon sp. OTE_75_metabat_556]|nr:hypothetical protein [Chamaesiphon sp. OTE_75_metabat_556]